MQRLGQFCRLGPFLVSLLPFLVIHPTRAQNSISLPPAQQGTVYSRQITSEGGLAPLSWRLANGDLPPGLSVSNDGKVEGKPTTAKRDPYIFTLSVSDSSEPAQTATMQFSIVIQAAPLRITGLAQAAATLKISGVAAVDDPTTDPPVVTKPAAAAMVKQNAVAHDQQSATSSSQNALTDASATAAAASTAAATQSPQNPCASGQPPFLNRPQATGEFTLDGCAESNGVAAVQVGVLPSGSSLPCSDPSKYPQEIQARLLLAPSGATAVEFLADLRSPLAAGQLVCIAEMSSTGVVVKTSQPLLVPGEETVHACESASAAYFPEPPVTGRKIVSGCAGKAPAVRVLVYSKNTNEVCPDPTKPTPNGTAEQLANVNPQTGIFQAEFDKPLADDELICAYALGVTPKPAVIVTKWGYEEADSPMGRTRYYLSTGVELSQDNQQFSSQDLYLGFALDRNWIRGSPGSAFTTLFNSEFSAQLASIPVAASSTTTTTTMTTPSVSTFISSRKAAIVSGDLYAPMYFNAFKGWFGTQTTAFFAPIIKGGLQTITSGALSASAPAPGTTTTTTTVNSVGLYYFWGMGIRLGDLKLHRSWNMAPEVLSHLDLTVGQWENFKQCRHASNCTPGADGTVPSNQLYQPWLFALEGQFNVPKTPVVIGFKATTPILGGGGQGDLRFFFGVKLDVGCIYKSFKGGTTPSFLQCTDDQPAANNAVSNSATPPAKGSGAPPATNGATKTQ